MKTTVKFLIAGFSLFLLSSCEDVVQIKLDEGSKLYVIDAFVNDLRKPQIIRVLNNDSYFSNREAPPVTTANVILKDLTANTQYAFTYTDKGNYVFNLAPTETIAKVGHQYELNVTIDGDTYTALTIQKRTAGIDSINAEFNEGGGGFGGPAEPFYFCTLFAKDKIDINPDYYWIKTYRNDTLFSAPGDINVCIDGTGGPVTSSPEDSIRFTPPATFLSFKTYQSGSTCRAEIHSLSRETYYFLVQAVAQVNNGGLFALTPENVKTNIKTPEGAAIKGVGWFNMATVASKTKIIP
jgi:hypothetical protein